MLPVILGVCERVCVAADNEEIISTLSSLAFPRRSILQCFSLYSAFVSEHLFLAPLPSARGTLKGFSLL